MEMNDDDEPAAFGAFPRPPSLDSHGAPPSQSNFKDRDLFGLDAASHSLVVVPARIHAGSAAGTSIQSPALVSRFPPWPGPWFPSLSAAMKSSSSSLLTLRAGPR